MPGNKKQPTREEMIRAEKEVGENLPEGMVGLDNGDIRREGDVEPDSTKGGTDEAESRH